jgi:hypothetical protein
VGRQIGRTIHVLYVTDDENSALMGKIKALAL